MTDLMASPYRNDRSMTVASKSSAGCFRIHPGLRKPLQERHRSRWYRERLVERSRPTEG